jgi:hypothetical protein
MSRQLRTLAEPGAEHAGQEPVEILRIPPAIHVGLTEAQGSLRQHAGEQPRIVHARISRLLTINADVAVRQIPGYGFSGAREHRSASLLLRTDVLSNA